MNKLFVIILICASLSLFVDYEAYADPEEKSVEIFDESHNETESHGPPDSHEAMNNRRDKRNYEFLIGLVHNNSHYEVTRHEPPDQSQGSEAEASELLLELMVKIAAQPERWGQVHALLQRIDADLEASKKLLDEYREKKTLKTNTLPYVPGMVAKQPPPPPPPGFYSQKPNGYIAVSVIAPKPIDEGRNELDGLSLENELKKLKPWNHREHLENMAKLRGEWLKMKKDQQT